MGQNISIVKVDEWGKVLDELDVNFAEVHHEIDDLGKWKEFEQNYIWLSTIDAFGHTYFNLLQMPFVIKELKRLKKELKNENVLSGIDKLIEFGKDLEDHDFIKFIGD